MSTLSIQAEEAGNGVPVISSTVAAGGSSVDDSQLLATDDDTSTGGESLPSGLSSASTTKIAEGTAHDDETPQKVLLDGGVEEAQREEGSSEDHVNGDSMPPLVGETPREFKENGSTPEQIPKENGPSTSPVKTVGEKEHQRKSSESTLLRLINISAALQRVTANEADLSRELANLQKRKATFVSKSQVYSAHIKAVNHNKDALDAKLKKLETDTHLSNKYLQEHLQERNELRERISKTEDNKKTITINIQGGLHLKRQAELENERYKQRRDQLREKKEIMTKRKEELTNLVAKCAEQKKANEEKLAIMHMKLRTLQKELHACDPRQESELDTLQEQQALLKDMLDGLEQSIAFGARNLKMKQESLKESCREENKIVSLVSELNKKIKEHKDLITAMRVSERELNQEAERLKSEHNDAVKHLKSIEKMITSLRTNFQKRSDDQKQIQNGVNRLKDTKQKFSEKMLEVLDQQDILSDRIAKIKGIQRSLEMERRTLLKERHVIEKTLHGASRAHQTDRTEVESKSATAPVSYKHAMSMRIDGELVVTAFLIVYEPQSVIHDIYKLCIDMQDITGGVYLQPDGETSQNGADDDKPEPKGHLCIFLKDGYQNRFLFDPETGEMGKEDNPSSMLVFSGDAKSLSTMALLIQENCFPDHDDSQSSSDSQDLPPLEPGDLPNLESRKNPPATSNSNDTTITEHKQNHPQTHPSSSSSTSKEPLHPSLPPEQQLNFSIDGESHILTTPQLQDLINAVPPRHHFRTWKCYFSTYLHGMSLLTFFRRMRSVPVSVIIIRDSGKKIFGGFASAPWKVSSNYYGDGDSFVYQFGPQFIKYSSTLRNDYYMLSGHNSLSMGGGQHVALYLDSEFLSGFSGKSDTYENPSLSSTRDFTCHRFEAWGPDPTTVQ